MFKSPAWCLGRAGAQPVLFTPPPSLVSFSHCSEGKSLGKSFNVSGPQLTSLENGTLPPPPQNWSWENHGSREGCYYLMDIFTPPTFWAWTSLQCLTVLCSVQSSETFLFSYPMLGVCSRPQSTCSWEPHRRHSIKCVEGIKPWVDCVALG